MNNTLKKTFIIFISLLMILSCSEDNSKNGSSKPNIETEKLTYLENQKITINFDNMSTHEHDWIGVYPIGVTSDWGNQLYWTWTGGNIKGQKQFDALPLGTYEVRAFFENSFTEQAIHSFKVDGEYNPNSNVNLALNKNEYLENELVYVKATNMKGLQSDWIGLYDSDSQKLIDSKQTEGSVNLELSLANLDTLPDKVNISGGLKTGNYEIKAFFNNTFNVEQVASFTVVNKPVTSTVYESANGTISPHWQHISGPTNAYYDQGMVNLTHNWIDDFTNTSEYRLVFPEPNTTQKILELDAGGLRYQYHFYIGVIVDTLYGPRKMIWDPFFTHENTKAFKSGQYFSYPLYVDIQEGSETKQHVRVDVEKYLRILEPNNKIISISAFIASGGDLDEIKLSSH